MTVERPDSEFSIEQTLFRSIALRSLVLTSLLRGLGRVEILVVTCGTAVVAIVQSAASPLVSSISVVCVTLAAVVGIITSRKGS